MKYPQKHTRYETLGIHVANFVLANFTVLKVGTTLHANNHMTHMLHTLAGVPSQRYQFHSPSIPGTRPSVKWGGGREKLLHV